jgi:hypothetical protein
MKLQSKIPGQFDLSKLVASASALNCLCPNDHRFFGHPRTLAGGGSARALQAAGAKGACGSRPKRAIPSELAKHLATQHAAPHAVHLFPIARSKPHQSKRPVRGEAEGARLVGIAALKPKGTPIFQQLEN